MYALLIANDQDDIAIFSAMLQQAGLAVTTMKNFDKAMQNWPERPVDIILLALSQPSPQDQVRQIRTEAKVPLLLALNTLDEPLHCELLRLGAALVINPPFSIKLLIAQIRVLMRRASTVPAFSLSSLSASGLTLDPVIRTVEVPGRGPQRLTHLKFHLLYTLMASHGQIIPTETIVERVWGYAGQGGRDLVRGLVSRLRNKVERNPRKPKYILTISGVGYSFGGDD